MDHNFSFHCTICFEALDSEERAPVVLPCGHTFICQQCSSRLDKCMECRQPLFRTEFIENKNGSHEARPRRQQRRNSLPSVLSNNPELKDSARFAVEKKRLPTPKNMVLLSLMESSRWSERDNSMKDKVFEDQDDNAFVNEGIEQLHSNFGTYAVREREGLTICESNTTTSCGSKKKRGTKEDHDQSMDLGDVVVTEDSFDTRGHVSTEMKLLENSHEQGKLEYGRTVQVVKFENGKAQLARGAGSLEVKPGQLVKVGAARDRACQIEGRMLSFEKQKEEMRLKMKKIEKEISNLTKELPKATALPFIDSTSAGSDSKEEEVVSSFAQKDNVSTPPAPQLTITTSNSFSSSWSGFLDDAASFFREQGPQEKSQKPQNSPSRPARRRSSASGVDFSNGFSGYGHSGHRTTPRRQSNRPIRRMSAY